MKRQKNDIGEYMSAFNDYAVEKMDYPALIYLYISVER